MNKILKAEKYYLVIIFLAVLIKSIYSSKLGFSLIDEGEYLHNALRILNGDLPYRDFFSYQPPLYNYWNTVAFSLLGTEVFSARLLNSLIFTFVPVLFYLIARKFSARIIAFLFALSLAFMELSMERLYYYIFTFSGLLLFFHSLRGNRKTLFASGLLFGLTSMFRLDIGILYFIGLCIGIFIGDLNLNREILLSKTKTLLVFLAGFSVPILTMGIWLVANNVHEEFIRSQLGTPIQITTYNSLPTPKPWEVIPIDLNPKTLFHSYETYVFYLFVAIYVAFGIKLFRHWKSIWSKTPELIFLFLIATLTFPYMLGRTDLGHIVKASMPLFFIGTYLITKLKHFKRNIAIILIPVVFIAVGTAQYFWSQKFYDTTVSTNNGVIRLNSEWPMGSVLVSAKSMEKSLSFIENNSEASDEVLFAPYMPGIYFLADRPANSYVGNILYTYLPDEEEYVRELAELDISLVIYDPSNGPANENGPMQLKDYYPLVHKHIEANYSTIETLPEGWQLMLRNN